MIDLMNCDCMEYMKSLEDNAFDLAIVDPPYGIGVGSMAYTNGVAVVGNALAKRNDYSNCGDWDKSRPNADYFKELFRVSKDQIIWGGNYFADMLPPTKSWCVWDKKIDDKYRNSFADCELAWSSKYVARMCRLMWNGMIQHDMKNKEKRIHPTQKPVALYKWLLQNYAKEGDKILDTHLGSGSIAVACHDLKFDLTACEIDETYYTKALERLTQHQRQLLLF